jgi:hypothetical protein
MEESMNIGHVADERKRLDVEYEDWHDIPLQVGDLLMEVRRHVFVEEGAEDTVNVHLKRPSGHLHLVGLTPCDCQALVAALAAHALPR